METLRQQAPPASYRTLSALIRDAGLLDKRPAYYSAKITLTVVAYFAGWVALVMVGNSWIALLCAAGLAVMFTQVAFIGHDAGHNQIASSRRINQIIGLLAGNLLTGMSLGWWVPKHNAHHAHPNEPDRDPDVGPGVLAFSLTARDAAQRSGTGRFIARHQAWLFVPLLSIEGLGLHITSIDWLARRRNRMALTEAILIFVHFALYATVVFSVLSPLRAIAFIALQQCLFGLYLGCSFAPNHKGMPMPTLTDDPPMSFAARQVITARNVTGGVVIDFLLGGLNHQIEHHLFPVMCRPNLAKAQSFVRAFCAEQGLPYVETGLISSYRMALSHLAMVSRAA